MESDSCRHNNQLLIECLSQLEAEDILHPISKTQLISLEDSYDTILAIIKKNPHSCYPVYDDGIDNIVGILHTYDLLINLPSPFNLSQLLKHPIFISENKNLIELLEEFSKRKLQIAIVVDEHGSVRGIVTPSDIMNILWVSERSESNIDDFVKIQNDQFLVDARFSLEEFNKKFNKQFQDIDCDSIGGYIIEKFTYVPEMGEQLTLDDITITINKTEGARLLEIIVSTKGKRG